MTDIATRIVNAKKVITGNESLLDMLDTEGATELLNWSLDMAGRLAQSTEGMDDSSAEQDLEARLKALRQFMRGAGNWAAGKYADATSRAQLKDKLLEQLKTMHGMDVKLPTAGELESLLSQGDHTHQQLIVKLKDFLAKTG